MLVSSLISTSLEDFDFEEDIISSSSSDFKILIITSSKEKLPGPVKAIEVAEAKYKSKSSSKKILKPEAVSYTHLTLPTKVTV